MNRSTFGLPLVLLLTCALALGTALFAPASSVAELPPPPPIEYPYYTLPEVSVEVHGTYSEHYKAPVTGDTEDIDFQFALTRSYGDVEWWSSTSPPSAGSQLGFLMKPSVVHLESSGTYHSKSGTVEGQTECSYSQANPEPTPPPEAGPFAGLIEMTPNAEAAGAMSVRFSYPLAANLVTVSGEECESVKAVGTSGTFEQEGEEFREALSPVDLYAVDSTSGAAVQTFTFSHPYSRTENNDTVDLDAEVTVKVNRLPPLPPPMGTKGPPEQHGPSTPITQPTTPPKPPVIREPEVEANPPVVTGGGGSPPKLHTGITAKCPPAGKPCTVTGIVEAELPAPRPGQKADTSRKAKVRRVVLGKVSFALGAGASKKVVIALSKAGAALLRSHPGVRAKIAVTVSAPGTATASRTRTAKLRLPTTRRRG